MEERILIEAESTVPKSIRTITSVIFVILGVVGLVMLYFKARSENMIASSHMVGDAFYSYAEMDRMKSAYEITSILFFIVLIIGLFFLFLRMPAGNKIGVTNKRVYGITTQGKRVDIPIDAISSVSSGSAKEISIASSYGVSKFMGIKEKDQVQNTINMLLAARQNNGTYF